jgi:hypothetical protein
MPGDTQRVSLVDGDSVLVVPVRPAQTRADCTFLAAENQNLHINRAFYEIGMVKSRANRL